jgi:nucleoid DNA-binding protein
MSKLGNKELSSSLSDKHGLNKTDAEKFVATLFDVINEGLESDKLVKVKGLGTFKIIGVAARKSVDVNTGAPIVIEGRDKISFTPDATLRDEVNKPFSQFDTVVLNDGVDFSTIDKEFEEDPEAAVLKAIGETTAPEAPVLEPSNEEASNEKVAIEDVATKEEAEVPHSEEKSEIEEVHEAVEPSKENIPIVGSVESPSEESPIDKNPVVIEQHEEVEENKVEDKSAVEQPQYDEEIVEEHQNNALKILIVAAAVIVIGCIGGGYYLFKQIEKRDSHIELLEKQMKIVAQNQKKHTIARLQRHAAPKSIDTLKASTASQLKAAETAKAGSEEESQEKALQAKYNRDPRIRTGAYIITGIKKTVTVRAGQTMNGISRTALGPGMECYVEAVNGGQRELKEGEKINIPSLKLKKRLK